VKPTIGLPVWLWAGETEPVTTKDRLQPLAGTVVFVHGDGDVAVSYVDHSGNRGFVHQVTLHEPSPGDQHGPEGSDGFTATYIPLPKTASPPPPSAAPAAPVAPAIKK
jgi:hypothetical protein